MADIPPLPEAITELPDNQLRRGIAAWKAGQTLLKAIDDWILWLAESRSQFRNDGQYDRAKGDQIARTGGSAIRTLVSLGINRAAFSCDADELLDDWPIPLSELLEPDIYVDPDSLGIIDSQEGKIANVLRQAVKDLLEDLARTPFGVFHATATEAVYPNDARDSWLYEQLCNTHTKQTTIESRFEKQCQAQGWVCVSLKSMKEAANRWAQRNGKKPIPKRKHGAPADNGGK